MSETSGNTNFIKGDEIDLIEVFKRIWGGRKTIYKSIGIFFIVGLMIIIGSPKEYKSEVTLLVETNSTEGGMGGLLKQFGGLAGMAGISLGSGMDGDEALTPDLYPDIIQSTPFLLEIMNEKICDSKFDSTLKVSEFLNRHTKLGILGIGLEFTIGLPGKFFGLFRKSGFQESDNKHDFKEPIKLTKEQSRIAKALMKRINVNQGKSNSNTLIISAEMQDPLLAANLVDSVVKSLTRYIIDYRTQKAKVDLQFVLENQKDAEKRFVKAQTALANFQDKNRNVILASAQVEGQNLQSEYNLAFNLYNTLSQQLEQTKMKVQDKTPVFKVIEPAIVPLQKDKPKTILILVAMIIFGGLVGSGLIFLKPLMKFMQK